MDNGSLRSRQSTVVTEDNDNDDHAPISDEIRILKRTTDGGASLEASSNHAAYGTL